MRVQRSEERYSISGEGWTGRCCFSYDQHYDPANVSFGSLLACNEFVVRPGAGFGLHAHTGIDIVTVVLEGRLTSVHASGDRGSSAGPLGLPDLPRSRGGEGRREQGPGVYVAAAAAGMEHDERNEGPVPVRFLQVWLLPGDGDPRPWRHDLASHRSTLLGEREFAFVTAGSVELGGALLYPGDSARMVAPETLTAVEDAAVLVWSC